MPPSPRLWIATFVALVFLIGGLAGVVVDRLWLTPSSWPQGQGFGPGSGRGPGPGPGRGPGQIVQSPERVIEDLDQQLALTPDQEASILRILEESRPRVREVQEATRNQFVEMQQKLRAEIAGVLTPEQRERFQQMGPGALEGGRGPGGGAGPGRGMRRGR